MDVVEKVVLPNIKLFLVVVFLIPVAFSLFFNQDISSVILAVDGDRYLYLKRFKPTLEISYDRFFDLLMFQAWGALGISTPFIWITFSLLISLAKFEK
ncbi:hypothetical protein [Gynuella sp.]|uniref:hypothetical protein n=1 Tax=Gynuella sp. TaxID=2969146 RepID=UPI003D1123C9